MPRSGLKTHWIAYPVSSSPYPRFREEPFVFPQTLLQARVIRTSRLSGRMSCWRPSRTFTAQSGSTSRIRPTATRSNSRLFRRDSSAPLPGLTKPGIHDEDLFMERNGSASGTANATLGGLFGLCVYGGFQPLSHGACDSNCYCEFLVTTKTINRYCSTIWRVPPTLRVLAV